MFPCCFGAMFVVAACLASPSAFSQESDRACDPLRFKIDKEKNVFNEQQEVWLGEILDDQYARRYTFVEDPEGDYLQKLGERLLAQLPPSGKKYQFHIIDDPDNNAFSFGGANVFVSRRLIVSRSSLNSRSLIDSGGHLRPVGFSAGGCLKSFNLRWRFLSPRK